MEYTPTKMMFKEEFAQEVFRCTYRTLRRKMDSFKQIDAELRKLKVKKMDKMLSPLAQMVIIKYLGG